MKITVGKSKRIMASEDYATLRGMDFRKARDILTKDGFHEHEYGDKDDNNGYAVYRKGDKEVELQYRWNQGKRKGEAHAGKVTNVYVDDDINSACGKKSVKAAKNIKKKPRNVQVYFWHNNAYNAVVMTDGEYWITFDDSFDGIDLYDEDVITELKSYIKTTDFNDFDDMYNQFANDENGNSPVVGDNFGGEFDTSELTKVGTIYEGKTNSACTKKSVKSNKRRGIKASHSKAPRRRMNVMAGPGAGYTIEWELDSIRNVNSFDVVDVSKPDEWGTVTVTADCDVDIDVTIKSAWSYMYGFNHPIEGVSAKIHRVVFDYNISDNYGDLLNFEDYENLTEDSEYIDEVMNAVYQINEMEAMNILENDAWETIKGDEFSYGGGWSHSTWDGTILEVDKYNFADIQVTNQMVIEYVDAAVTNENLYVEYKIDASEFRDEYFDTEEDARNAAIEAIQSGDIVDMDLPIIKTEWHEILLNTMGETDLDDPYDEEVDTVYYDDYAPEVVDEE